MTYGKHRHVNSETGTEDRSDTASESSGPFYLLLLPDRLWATGSLQESLDPCESWPGAG